jgi:hypothetical protein
MKEARRYLTQGRQIAKRQGYNQLALKFSNEQDKLLKQSDLWERLKDSNASLSDRMELARISEHMNGMLRNRQMLFTQITEDKVTIHTERKICLVCKGEIGGHIYVCECDAFYCENCAQALTDLENMCWVCNAPMDPSKSIKPFRKDSNKK